MFLPKIKYTTRARLKQLERDVGNSKYRNWRNVVLARDNNQCQWPGCKKTTELQVHHIQRWADAKHLRFNIYNGITLCREHHTKIQGREAHYAVSFLKRVLYNSDNYQRNKHEKDNADNL